MQVFTYSQARQNFAKLLVLAQDEEVEIRRKDGSVFSLVSKKSDTRSPFDIDGIDVQASTKNILDSIRESRSY